MYFKEKFPRRLFWEWCLVAPLTETIRNRHITFSIFIVILFVGFYVDGQSLPSKPLQPNYETENFLDAYQTLVLGRERVSVERGEYPVGNALYVVNINPYIDFNKKRKGHCRLELKFALPLPESVTLILYGKFSQVLHIDQSRSIIFK